MYPSIRYLLLSGLLIDTNNLDLICGRTTPKDEKMARYLETSLIAYEKNLNDQCLIKEGQAYSRIDYFNSIRKARNDTSGLSSMELLERDYKSLPAHSIGIR